MNLSQQNRMLGIITVMYGCTICSVPFRSLHTVRDECSLRCVQGNIRVGWRKVIRIMCFSKKS